MYEINLNENNYISLAYSMEYVLEIEKWMLNNHHI